MTISVSVMMPMARSAFTMTIEPMSILAIDLATSRTVASGGIVTTFTDMISLTGIIGVGSDIGMTSIRQKVGLPLWMGVI